ncbi:hypothetical protein [Undibacterium fentianense]|uniref:Uncharacterized protein n=1 Tax=Undibacterium fentianense TaxID=2828728 RepID=A0A941E6A4_9BURK|nr:hypothetical protein [Undibacterium fentianense]MBR7800548.1 hypothetical protein [Undibacterium fentianense]
MIPKSTQIYWVVATHTNAGKTTLATELIRVLNQAGCPSLGFKPFAGMRLRDGVDYMFGQSIELNQRMAFSDGALLCHASPLTSTDDLDLVVPRQVIFKDRILDTFLMRIGSASLQNVEMWTSEKGQRLANRPDIAYLLEKTGLPFANAQLLDGISSPYKILGREKVQAAFMHLQARQPQAIVCEGAGPWLPVWQDQAYVNHVFLLTEDSLYFYRDANLSIDTQTTHAIAPDFHTLLRVLQEQDCKGVKHPLWILDASRRQASLQGMLQRLLHT